MVRFGVPTAPGGLHRSTVLSRPRARCTVYRPNCRAGPSLALTRKRIDFVP